MGFGLLFIGACLLVPTCFGYFYTAPVAAILMAFALRRLAKVNTPFGYAVFVAWTLLGVSLAEIVLRTIGLENPAAVLDGVGYLVLLVLWILIFTGIEWVAAETREMKLRGKALRQKVFSAIYLILLAPLNFIVGVSLPEGAIRLLSGLSVALMWVGLVVIVMSLSTIYTAYMRICMPEDLDMAVKPSRFAFINRFREAKAEREAEHAALQREADKIRQKRKKK